MTPVEPEQLFGKQLVRKLLVPVMLGAVAYSVLLLYGDASGVAEGLRHLPLNALLLGLAISLASFAVRGARWGHFLRVIRVDVPFWDNVLVFLAGLGMSITPGKLGELLKSLLLKERLDVPVARSAPIIVAERLMDLATLVILGAVGLTWGKNAWAAAALAALGTVLFYAFGRSRPAAVVVVNALARIPLAARYRDKLLAAHASLYELWGLRSYAIGMTLSFLTWGLQASILTLFAASLPDSPVTLPQALVAYSAPLIAGAIALLPGGLGLTEASMTGALRALSGMSATAATTLTILLRGTTFWLAILLGFSALGVWRARRRPEAVWESPQA